MLMESARILWRRRVWVVVSLVIALAAGAGSFYVIPPTQQSTAQVLFIPSVKEAGVTGPTNPFLSLGGSVAIVAALVLISVSDDQTTEQIAAQGLRAKFTVTPNLAQNAGPVVIVTTEDHSSAMAQSTLKGIIQTIQDRLRQIQVNQKVDPDLMITSVVLAESAKPTLLHKTQIQVAAVAFLGTLMTFLGLILLGARRHRRRRVRNVPATTERPGSPASVTGSGRAQDGTDSGWNGDEPGELELVDGDVDATTPSHP